MSFEAPQENQAGLPEDGALPAELTRALQAAYRGPEVPRERDLRILRDASVMIRRRTLLWMWGARAGVGLAAAVMVAACLRLAHSFERSDPLRGSAPHSLAADIDADGRVDIVDAMVLARAQRERPMGPAARDINGDGVIDQRDVDALAAIAVRLDRGGA